MQALTQTPRADRINRAGIRTIGINTLSLLKADIWKHIQEIITQDPKKLDLARTIYQKSHHDYNTASELMFQLQRIDPDLVFWLSLIIFIKSGYKTVL